MASYPQTPLLRAATVSWTSAEEALDRAGRTPRNFEGLADSEIVHSPSINLRDDDAVKTAKRMAIVYTAIAAFEHAARKLITNVYPRRLERIGGTLVFLKTSGNV